MATPPAVFDPIKQLRGAYQQKFRALRDRDFGRVSGAEDVIRKLRAFLSPAQEAEIRREEEAAYSEESRARADYSPAFPPRYGK